jgi:hypothetical protein
MIGRRDTSATHRSASAIAVACLCSVALLSGCTDLRRAIGMDRAGPDEFAVESRAPLTIPPDFDLRPPQPGAPRPQEGTAAERARKVIDTAGPGEPGKQQTVALKPGEGGGIREPADKQQTADQGLANKLLGSSDTASGAQRQTTPMKGVY